MLNIRHETASVANRAHMAAVLVAGWRGGHARLARCRGRRRGSQFPWFVLQRHFGCYEANVSLRRNGEDLAYGGCGPWGYRPLPAVIRQKVVRHVARGDGRPAFCRGDLELSELNVGLAGIFGEQ